MSLTGSTQFHTSNLGKPLPPGNSEGWKTYLMWFGLLAIISAPGIFMFINSDSILMTYPARDCLQRESKLRQTYFNGKFSYMPQSICVLYTEDLFMNYKGIKYKLVPQ